MVGVNKGFNGWRVVGSLYSNHAATLASKPLNHE